MMKSVQAPADSGSSESLVCSLIWEDNPRLAYLFPTNIKTDDGLYNYNVPSRDSPTKKPNANSKDPDAACCSQAPATDNNYGLRSFFRNPTCPTVSPCSLASQDSNDVTPRTYSTVERRALLLDEVLSRVPCIRTDLGAMAAWTDVKEIFFERCSSKNCNIVKNALKRQFKFPHVPRRMHPCTPDEQVMFLKRCLHLVSQGTLLVEVEAVLVALDSLQMVVATKHLATKEARSMECSYVREKEVYKKNNPMLNWNRIKQKQKSEWHLLPTVIGRVYRMDGPGVILDPQSACVPLSMLMAVFPERHQQLLILAANFIRNIDDNVVKRCSVHEAKLLNMWHLNMQGSSSLLVTSNDLLVKWRDILEIVDQADGGSSPKLTSLNERDFVRRTRNTPRRRSGTKPRTPRQKGKRKSKERTTATAENTTKPEDVESHTTSDTRHCADLKCPTAEGLHGLQQTSQDLQNQWIVPDNPTTREHVGTVDSSTLPVVYDDESNTFQEGCLTSKADDAGFKDASEYLGASGCEPARSNADNDTGNKSRLYRRSTTRRSKRRPTRGKTKPSSEDSRRDSNRDRTTMKPQKEALSPAGNRETNKNQTGISFISASAPRVQDYFTDDAGGCDEERAAFPQNVVVGEASTSGASPRGNSSTPSGIYSGFKNIANLFTILSNDEVCHRTHMLTLDEIINSEEPKEPSPRNDVLNISVKRLRSRVVPSRKVIYEKKQNSQKYTEPDVAKSTNKHPQTESQAEDTWIENTAVSITDIIKNMDTMFNSLKPDPLAIARAKIKITQQNGQACVQIYNRDVPKPAETNPRASANVSILVKRKFDKFATKPSTQYSNEQLHDKSQTKASSTAILPHLGPNQSKPQATSISSILKNESCLRDSNLLGKNSDGMTSASEVNKTMRSTNARPGDTKKDKSPEHFKDVNPSTTFGMSSSNERNVLKISDKSSERETRKPHWDLKTIFGKSSKSGKRGVRDRAKRANMDADFHAMKEKMIARTKSQVTEKYTSFKEKIAVRRNNPVALANGSKSGDGKHKTHKSEISAKSASTSVSKLCKETASGSCSGVNDIGGRTLRNEKLMQGDNKLVQGNEKLVHTEKKLVEVQKKIAHGKKLVQGDEKLVHTEEKLVHTEEKLVEVQKKIAQGKKLVQGDEKLVQDKTDKSVQKHVRGEKLMQGEDSLVQVQNPMKGDEKLVEVQEKIVQGEENLVQAESKNHPKIDEEFPKTKETFHAYTSEYDIASYWKGFPTGECSPGRGSPRQRHLTYPTDRSPSTSISGRSRCASSKARASSMKPIALRSFPEIVEYARSVSAEWTQICKWKAALTSGRESAACGTTNQKQLSLPTIRTNATSLKENENATVSRKSRLTRFDSAEAIDDCKSIQNGSMYPKGRGNLKEDRKVGKLETSHPSSGIKVPATVSFHDKSRMTTANNLMKLKSIIRIADECRKSPEQQIAIQKRKGPKHLENGDVLKWNDVKEFWAIETNHQNSNENNSESTNDSTANKATSTSCVFDDLLASAMNSFEIARKCLLKSNNSININANNSKDSNDNNSTKLKDSNDINTQALKDSNDSNATKVKDSNGSNTNNSKDSNDKNTNNNMEDPHGEESSGSRNSCSPHGSDADISSGPSTNGSCPPMLNTEAGQGACPPSRTVIRGKPIKKNILLRETLKDNFDLIKNISTQICTCKEALSFLKRDKNASRKVFLRKWYLEMMRHCPLHSEETQRRFQEQMFKVMKCLQAHRADKEDTESSGKSVKATSRRKSKVKRRKRVKDKDKGDPSEINKVFPERAVSDSKGRSLRDQVSATAAKEYLAAYTHNYYKKELLDRYEYEKVVSDVSEPKTTRRTRRRKSSSRSTACQSPADKDCRKESRELRELKRRLAPRDYDVTEQKLFMDILKGTSRPSVHINEAGLQDVRPGASRYGDADRSASDSTAADTATSREDNKKYTVSSGLESSNGKHSNPSCKIQYLAIMQSDADLNISYSGFAHIGDSILPYVIENGYKFTTLKEAASLLPWCSCTIIKSVLKKHLGLPRTFCSWEQVSLLTALTPRDSKTKIQTGDMIVRVDSLVQQLSEIETVLKSRHKTSTSKKSKACPCAQD